MNLKHREGAVCRNGRCIVQQWDFLGASTCRKVSQYLCLCLRWCCILFGNVVWYLLQARWRVPYFCQSTNVKLWGATFHWPFDSAAPLHYFCDLPITNIHEGWPPTNEATSQISINVSLWHIFSIRIHPDISVCAPICPIWLLIVIAKFIGLRIIE